MKTNINTNKNVIVNRIVAIFAVAIIAAFSYAPAYADDWNNTDNKAPLYVYGELVSASNSSGDGWSYDSNTNTLTLNGFMYDGISDFEIAGSGEFTNGPIHTEGIFVLKVVGFNYIKVKSGEPISSTGYSIHFADNESRLHLIDSNGSIFTWADTGAYEGELDGWFTDDANDEPQEDFSDNDEFIDEDSDDVDDIPMDDMPADDIEEDIDDEDIYEDEIIPDDGIDEGNADIEDVPMNDAEGNTPEEEDVPENDRAEATTEDTPKDNDEEPINLATHLNPTYNNIYNAASPKQTVELPKSDVEYVIVRELETRTAEMNTNPVVKNKDRVRSAEAKSEYESDRSVSPDTSDSRNLGAIFALVGAMIMGFIGLAVYIRYRYFYS